MGSIDGGIPIALPLNKKTLAAGHHVIRFIDPKSSEVLDTQSIDLANGQSLIVIQH
jgi:hypothetical protein